MPLDVLFVMRHSGFVRNFEAVLDELGRRGRRVHLAFEIPREQAEVAEALCARHPTLSFGPAPRRADRWTGVAYRLRSAIDALRYRTAAYADAPKLRARGLGSAPSAIRWLPLRGERSVRALGAVLRRLDAALPVDPAIDAWLGEQAPRAVLVTPLVDGPSQSDVVRAARARGIPAALCVASWDNLTNKGVIRDELERVFVWNDAQRREAVELHGVAAERVVATGAHTFDHWFAWEPSSSREDFCRRAGLPADRPVLLYLCSSAFIAPDEARFVRRWLAELRRGPAPLCDAAVLIRPHPASGARWAEADLGDAGPVSVWPPVGADPRTDAPKRDYFDSMFHAAAAVGVNTTALIELAIVGRPAFTVLDRDFADTQRGTLHFSHLAPVLTVAESFGEHLDQLRGALADGAPGGERRRAFVASFVRPRGTAEPAAPVLADAIDGLPAPAPAPAAARRIDPVLRALMAPVARALPGPPRKGGLRGRLRKELRRRRVHKRARRALDLVRPARRRS